MSQASGFDLFGTKFLSISAIDFLGQRITIEFYVLGGFSALLNSVHQ